MIGDEIKGVYKDKDKDREEKKGKKTNY